jgi:hypothetical protein
MKLSSFLKRVASKNEDLTWSNPKEYQQRITQGTRSICLPRFDSTKNLHPHWGVHLGCVFSTVSLSLKRSLRSSLSFPSPIMRHKSLQGSPQIWRLLLAFTNEWESKLYAQMITRGSTHSLLMYFHKAVLHNAQCTRVAISCLILSFVALVRL